MKAFGMTLGFCVLMIGSAWALLQSGEDPRGAAPEAKDPAALLIEEPSSADVESRRHLEQVLATVPKDSFAELPQDVMALEDSPSEPSLSAWERLAPLVESRLRRLEATKPTPSIEFIHLVARVEVDLESFSDTEFLYAYDEFCRLESACSQELADIQRRCLIGDHPGGESEDSVIRRYRSMQKQVFAR